MLLRTMQPQQRAGRFVFVSWPEAPPPPATAVSVCWESEGLSVLLLEGEALDAGLAPSAPLVWIELTVHSDLKAVGLTAAVSNVLAWAGIPCNVVAALRHDHLFVPEARVSEALEFLQRLSQVQPNSEESDTVQTATPDPRPS